MTQRFLRPTWAEVDLGSFRANLETVARLIPAGTGIMAVVKANGYGIGAIRAARTALTVPRVAGLAVATADEALELRDDGIQEPILVLGPVTTNAAMVMVERGVSITVTSVDTLHDAQDAGRFARRKAKVHLKIETGMGRIGMAPGDELDAALAALQEAPDVEVEGAFTHFAAADTDKAYTSMQMDAFHTALDRLSQMGVRPRFRHAANSAAILDFPRAHLDLVRPGIILYGSYPDQALSGKALMKPVLSLLSRVSHVKKVPAGYSVGYGRTHVTTHATTIATVPVGYADGYPRLLSGRGSVLLHDKRFPVTGRVCMDQIMVDVGNEKVQVGDLVTLIGTQGSETITVDEVAARAQTIAHEVLTGLTARVPRVYA